MHGKRFFKIAYNAFLKKDFLKTFDQVLKYSVVSSKFVWLLKGLFKKKLFWALERCNELCMLFGPKSTGTVSYIKFIE